MTDKIYIGIPRKIIEKAIEDEVRQYARKLINYPYVKNVFHSELQKFVKSKTKKKDIQ